MNYKIPTIEEIYNEYHRETFYASKGFYPKSIKNYDNILDNIKTELLIRFQNLIKRNFDMIDWKIYIKACAQYFKRNFDLKVLGSLQGNKIYRTYLSYNNIKEFSDNDIINEIVSSLKFIKVFCDKNSMKIHEYFLDRASVIPIILTHLYAGSVSAYFYATFDRDRVFRIFNDIYDDVYYHLFNCSRNEFLTNNIFNKHDKILCSPKIFNIINNINNKFKDII